MARLTPPVNDRDHIQGPNHAPVTLVEYGDFQCPYCGAAYPIIKEVQREMGDDLRFVYRHFPLTDEHPHAEEAAEAAECAAAQGAFWEMHDVLFEHQDALDLESLVDYASRLGLDAARFQRDLKSHKFKEAVYQDFMSGVRSGVNGTPTLYINGDRYEGRVDVDSLMEALQETVR